MKTDIIPAPLPLERGLIARLAIQCTCPDTGHTGSFLFTGPTHRASQSRVSPVFHDLYEMFTSPAFRADWQEVVNGNAGHGYIKR